MKTLSLKLLTFLATVWFVGLMVTACSEDDTTPPVDTTALSDAITAAEELLSTTSEGVAEGNYLKGSKAPLEAAITAAKAVLDDETATQATVTNAVASLTAAVAAYEDNKVVPIDPDNLAAQWTFDEISSAAVGSVVKDYSGNGNNGTIKAGHAEFGAGTPALTADRYGNAGKALLFDKGGNVEIPYNTQLNSASISISVWVKLQEVRNNRFIGLQSWIGYKFEVESGNKPFATIGHSDGAYDRDTELPINQNEWYHLVMTFKAGEMVFYINGEKVKTWDNTPNAARSIADKPYNLVLGCDFPTDKYAADGDNFDTMGHPNYRVIPAAWGGYLHGALDEVRIYKTALTAAQVTSIYDLEKP